MLFRVEAGSETVGLLYCFLYNRWVYHYQSGFSYSVNKRRNPGLLTLYYAIDYCMQQQAIEGFDFMAGDSEYKRTLTNESGQRPLRWFVIRRRTVPSLLYVFLRGMKRKYGPASAAAAAGPHSTGDVDPADAAQRQNGVETT